ncbi:phosphotransferase family protein [Deinococcus planocerae]|uniref:phosphotransferase family protein n=1 Tax=Deinococcus planocerae TaxID=1737569 RepID=UPI001FEB237B|nr:aminoglycoside phosphotransferase family protein [Deinococcus planocerae]
MRLGATLEDWRDTLRGEGPAVSSRVWPAELRAAFPGPRRALEAWEGEGAAFARYVTGHGPLFLKYLPAGWRDGRAYRRLAREASYLRDLAPRSPVPHAPLLHAALDPDGWRAHLVTRDLTDTTTGWGAFGTDHEREAALLEVARLLARHHAFWLDRPELAGEWGWDAERAARHAGRIAADPDPGWTPAEVEAVREAARLLPALLGATRGVTLAHGDLHAGQVLWPGGGGPPILIDYGQAHGSVLGEDLAHLLHVRLDAQGRARLGPGVREAYRAELAAHGPRRTPAQLMDEERAGLALNLLATARQARGGGSGGVREALGRVAGAWAQEGAAFRERRPSQSG